MEFTFLGTSAGVPCKHRNVTSLALKPDTGKYWYMVDCGEATQHQLLHTPFSVQSLKAIFITHVHGDHCYGLPGILASASMSGRKKTLVIVGPKEIEDFVKGVQKATHLWLDFELIFVDVVKAISKGDLIDFIDVKVEPFELSHRVPCFGYNFIEGKVQPQLDKNKLIAEGIKPGPIWGQLQKGIDAKDSDGITLKAKDYFLPPRDSRVVAVCGDNDDPKLVALVAHKPHVLLHEATYTIDIAQKVGAGPQHSWAQLVGQFAQDYGLAHLVLTHFSARFVDASSKAGLSIGDIRAEATDVYDGKLFLARDFETYRLDKDFNLSVLS